MTIRRMRVGEGKRLSELLYSSVHTLCTKDYSPDELEAWVPKNMDVKKLSRSLLMNVTWVAELQGMPVGFICLERDGYINRLFTHPDYTGRGIATALLETAINWAKRKNIKRIFLAASKTGYGFYLRNGFHVSGIETVERHGVTFENKIMEKFI